MKTNDYVPFQINYKIHTNYSSKYLNPAIVPCYESVSVSFFFNIILRKKISNFFILFHCQPDEPPCSCLDCSAKCPVPPKSPVKPSNLKLLGLNSLTFILASIFIVGSTLFLLGVCICSKNSSINKKKIIHFTMLKTKISYSF